MLPTDTNATSHASALATPLEIFADVLAQSEEEGLGDDFYSRLCEGITRCTAMRRVVLFRYDSARRRVYAAGSHGVELATFADYFFTAESAPIAMRALAEDRVLEIASEPGAQLPAEYVARLGAQSVVVTPVAARGRWMGVILSDRGGDETPLSEAEREVLWILGKMAALASMARAATRQYERAVQLEARIDLARELHESVIQRLFGVSLALSSEQPLDDESRRRCADELQQALGELRSAIQRPLGRSLPQTKTTLREEVARLRVEHPDLGIEVEPPGSELEVPAELEPLAQSVLAEAIRNAHKHARATRVGVHAELRDGAFVLEVTNDGVGGRAAGIAGMGLRLAGFEALQAGGLLEFGARDGDRWQVRLVVPHGEGAR
ncbi:MAG TPA: GAF domain-containing protein [Solirubrobacteraceae bacterium]|nr:GAF domain-containing protein [Solirubrobacteraceae bacterium]